MTSSLSRRTAKLLARWQAGAVPDDVRDKTRLHVADAVAIAMAARRGLRIAHDVGEAMRGGCGEGRCSVLGTSSKVAALAAAFSNSAAVHVLDYDDIHDEARLHPTAVTLPAALAVAETADAGGATLLDAVAIGNELMCRMGVMWHPTGKGPGSDWFLTQLFGYFGAAAAAGVVLGFDVDRMVSALGLAYMQAAGGKQAGFGTGSNARSIYPAFAAMGGVQAALLARAGVTGPEGSLDGAAGLFPAYLGAQADAAAVDVLLDPQRWQFRDTDVKPWPSCRLSHPYVAVALALRERLPDCPVERIVVAVNASAEKLCRPLPERRRPRTLQDAKYSIPFMTAFALVHGRVELASLDERALEDQQVLALAERVDIEESLPDRPGHPPAKISVETRSGRVDSPPLGDLRVTEARLRKKFFDCFAYSGQSAHARAAWDRIASLESIRVRSWVDTLPAVADRSQPGREQGVNGH